MSEFSIDLLKHANGRWGAVVWSGGPRTRRTVVTEAAGPTAHDTLRKLADVVLEKPELTTRLEAMEITTRRMR